MKNIQLFQPHYRTEEVLDLMRETMNSGWTGQGPRVAEFEQKFKDYTKLKTCHMVNSATSGLHLVLEQMKAKYDWDNDTEVITSPITFVSTNHAILYAGLNPVFADIDLNTGCLHTDCVLAKTSIFTRCIIFVGLGGNIGDLKDLIKKIDEQNEVLDDDFKMRIIIDAAHMAGVDLSWIKDYPVVEAVIYSFQSVKNLPTSDSGAVCWNSKTAENDDRISREMTWLGINKSTYSRTNSGSNYKWKYEVPSLGFKYHSNDIMACMALVSLKYLDEDNAHRSKVSFWYNNMLINLQAEGKIKIIFHEPGTSMHLYQVLIEPKDNMLHNYRDYVMQELNKAGIFPGVHYNTNQDYSMYQHQQRCLFADFWSNNIISLPIGLHIQEEDVIYICETLTKILQ